MLNSIKIARLPLGRLGDKFLTKVLTNFGFKGTNLLQLTHIQTGIKNPVPSRHFLRQSL